MINSTTAQTTRNLDIEQGATHQPASNSCKTAMVATCATLAGAFSALGGMLLLGATARTGPFAVPRDYQTTCYTSLLTHQSLGCQQEDQSEGTTITRGFLGLLSLATSATFAVFACRLSKAPAQTDNPSPQ